MPVLKIDAACSSTQFDGLRSEVRDFLAQELASGRVVSRNDNWLAGWDPAFSRRLGERGWIGMTFPIQYGGGAASPMARLVVTEELLAVGAPVAAHWIADRQSGPALLKFGSEEQKQTYLPGIASGDVYFAIGMSESESGSDLASVRTRAHRVDGGWLVNGRKTWTSGAHYAHAMIALVRTSARDEQRHAGLSQVIIDLQSPGVDIRPIRLLTGEHHFNEVALTDVFVSDRRLLGTIGAGWSQATSELAFERSGPERILSTFPLLAVAVQHLSRRTEPCVDPGRLGALVARLAGLRQMSAAVTARLAEGQLPTEEAALVKDLGTRFERMVIDVVRLLIRVQPELGSADPLARMLAESLLHSPGFTLRGGTNEILRGVVAKALLSGSR